MDANGNLAEIYSQGIERTGYKSTMLSKNNALRKLLNLPLRTEAVSEGHYDKPVYDALKAIDFSPLDGGSMYSTHTLGQTMVLSFAGAGLTPADEVVDNSHAVNLAGADNHTN
jgi:hypothetical protein